MELLDLMSGLRLPGCYATSGSGVLLVIAGCVYCKADATQHAIGPGDLLSTSRLAGHAMKAADREQAFGTILGKAVTGLKSGTGLILVLASLQ